MPWGRVLHASDAKLILKLSTWKKNKGNALVLLRYCHQHYKSCMLAVLENCQQAKTRSPIWGLAVYHAAIYQIVEWMIIEVVDDLIRYRR